MSEAADYRRATNEAYELLLSLPSFSLATDVFDVVKQLPDCIAITYQRAVNHYGAILGLDLDRLIAQSDHGFTLIQFRTQRRIILYNDALPETCIRFTIAHELGHYMLGHLPDDHNNHTESEEQEANCFARNLLCPIPIVKSLSLATAEEYRSLFQVSAEMAAVAVKHRGSDLYHISNRNYSDTLDLFYQYYLDMDFRSLREFYTVYPPEARHLLGGTL